MKRMWLALAAMAGVSVGTGRADPGGYAPPGGASAGYQLPSASQEFSAPGTVMGLGAAAPGKGPDRYGLLPGLRKAFRVGDTCPSCGCKGGHCSWCHKGKIGHGGGGGGGYGYGAPADPPVMQGTLVFPHHPYVRSPRDYFMYEPGP